MSRLMNVLTGTGGDNIEDLAKEVRSEFSDDEATPRVTVGQMQDGRWYMAVVRYPDGSNESKETVCKAVDQNFSQCFKKLVSKWNAGV